MPMTVHPGADTPSGILQYDTKLFGNIAASGSGTWPSTVVGGNREHVAAAAQHLSTLAPFIRWGIETSITNLVGRGLRPQPKINHRTLGITEKQATALGEAFEDEFGAWSSSRMSDTTCRMTFHQNVEAALRRAYSTGEMLFSIDWRWRFGSPWQTAVKALDPQRIDRAATTAGIPSGATIMQGVVLDADGAPIGLSIKKRQPLIGAIQQVEQFTTPEYRELATWWGRPKLSFAVLDREGPTVMRGISPIAAAIDRALKLDEITDLALKQRASQLLYSFALTTDLSPQEASGALDPKALQAQVAARLEVLNAHLALHHPRDPGDNSKIPVLPIGSRLDAVNPSMRTLGDDAWQRRLLLELARAFCLSYADLTGDYSSDSFSASRLSLAAPWEVVLRRRASFVAPIYADAYHAVIEEAICAGRIKLPSKLDFYSDREHLLAADWIGPSRPSADPSKDAAADAQNLANGTTTRSAIAASRGEDFEKIARTLAKEQALFKELGLPIGQPPASLNAEPDGDEEEKDDKPAKPKKKDDANG